MLIIILIYFPAQAQHGENNEAASATAANNTCHAAKLTSNFSLTNGSRLTSEENPLISRRHSSEMLVNLENENQNQTRSNEASNE